MHETHGDGLLHLLSASQVASLEGHNTVHQGSRASAAGARGDSGNSPSAVSELRSTPQQQISSLGDNLLVDQEQRQQQQQPVQSKPRRTYECHLCERTYERADHLQRHIKSHENTRPYQCTVCPQRFNRVDLLQRHQASHSRDAQPEPSGLTKNGRPRARIERLSRAATACIHCVASKTKCQDRKPCARCVRRHLNCTTTPNARGSFSQSAVTNKDENGATSASDSNASQPWLPSIENSDSLSQAENVTRLARGNPQDADTVWRHGNMDPNMDSWDTGFSNDSNMVQSVEEPLMNAETFLQMSSFLDSDLGFGSGFGLMPKDAYLAQEADSALWNFSFDGLELAYESFGGQQMAQLLPDDNLSPSGNLLRAASQRHAAFERSAWIWKPTNSDQALNDQSDLRLDEENIPSILDPTSPSQDGDEFAACCIDTNMRDQIVGLLSRLAKDSNTTMSFPSLDLVNRIIRVYFAQATFWVDSMIHSATFDGCKALPQLNIAIIAAGASLSFIPAVWKMGMALQETVRLTVGEYWEQNNSNTRNLQALQAFVIGLDIGIWSGIKRKMEIAESFAQPVIAILRRAGAFAVSRTPAALMPSVEDSEAILESKWHIWAERESFKRLVLHLFAHDVFASAGLQKPPLMSFTELKFGLPCIEELWKARSASRWREVYLSTMTTHQIPDFMDVLFDPKLLTTHERQVNVHLSALTILHGFWVQIWNNLETKKYYVPARTTHRLCLLTSQTELYRDLVSFGAQLPSYTQNSAEATLMCELYMMILHAPPEDLQRFAGRFGEDEADDATEEFKGWIGTQDSRNAVWHAGQVFKAAALLGPMQLRGFNSIALYYATLTLWVFGLMSFEVNQSAQQSTMINEQIALNEVETVYSASFRDRNHGVPGLAVTKDGLRQFVPLHEANYVLQFARELYTSNFPISREPLPPLASGLRDLLKDLSSSLLTRQTTRAPTVAL